MNPEDSIEITAPSVEEAILLGLTRLSAIRDQVDIQVLEEGSKGFLGLGSRQAKVRLTRRDTSIEPREHIAASKAAGTEMEAMEAVEAMEIKEQEVESPEEAPEAPRLAPEKKPAPAPRPKLEKAPKMAPEPKKKEAAAPQPEEEKKPTPKKLEKAPAEPQEKRPAAREQVSGVDRDAVEAIALDVAEHLFADFDVEISTKWREEDRPTLWVSLSGNDASSLVGRRARTLSSIQYIMRALVHHNIGDQYYLVVDADGYRERRYRSLRSLAERKADEAVQKQRTIRLRSMPASERRIVHMSLREDNRVETQSVGSGRRRAVTIIPN